MAFDQTECMYRVSAKALIKNSQGELFFVDENEGHGLNLPGGGIDNGETPQDTLKREIHEEVGLDVISVADHPRFAWLINSEVVWLVYETEVSDTAEAKTTHHVAGFEWAKPGSEDIKSKWGYVSKLFMQDLIDYVKINS